MTDVDRCIRCGEAIPEGLQVCPVCNGDIVPSRHDRLRCKYTVYTETYIQTGFSGVTLKAVRSFRNERDAIAFISNPKNTRAYGDLWLERKKPDGSTCEWDLASGVWR